MHNWKLFRKTAQDLIALQQFEEAQEKIQAGLEKLPNQLNLLTIATDVYRASGDREKSLGYSELLITHHPENWQGYVRAAQDLIALQQFDEARKYLEDAERKEYNTTSVQLQISDLYRQANAYKNSQEISSSIIEKLPNAWTAYERLSSDLLSRGFIYQSKILKEKAMSMLNEEKHIPNNNNSAGDQNKSRELFLIAGCSGCGKSTLLQHLKGDWEKLFKPCASATKIPNPCAREMANQKKVESQCLKTTYRQDGYLIEPQITEARKDMNLPERVYMHMDIRDLLKFHANNILPSLEDSKEVRRGDLDILNEEVNNILTRKFLQDPFFKRFTCVHITTLLIGFKKNAKQFYSRNKQELFLLDETRAKKAYKEVYRCWLRNIKILNPKTSNIVTRGKNYYKVRPLTEDKER